jgi:hypothetical protein
MVLSRDMIWQRAHQGRLDLAILIFTTCDASANSVATIAKVTLTKLSREMLAFAHIPTGASANKGFDIHEGKDRIVAQPSR